MTQYVRWNAARLAAQELARNGGVNVSVWMECQGHAAPVYHVQAEQGRPPRDGAEFCFRVTPRGDFLIAKERGAA